jgi:cytoskeleton protein RodZ
MARGNFGERLKRERELREVTLDEINSATRISNRFLEAMENEDWQKLPGGVFNRGFVRSIARFLGLDEEGLLAEYDMAHGAQEQSAPKREEVRIPSPPRWVPVAAALGLLLLLAACIAGGIYAWRYFSARRAARQAGTASVVDGRVDPIASAAPASLPAPMADATSAVLLELNDEAMPTLGAPGTSGTITLSRKDLRREQSGATQRGSH